MISIVAAIGQNGELGKDNKLLWDIPEDLARFRDITKNHTIIMGRKTFESIGRILPNRTNIIITRDPSYQVEGGIVVHSLEEALTISQKKNSLDEIFIIGGGQIFKDALSITDRLYLTIVHASFDADTYFPEYPEFTKVISSEDHESSGYKYTYTTLEKQTS